MKKSAILILLTLSILQSKLSYGVVTIGNYDILDHGTDVIYLYHHINNSPINNEKFIINLPGKNTTYMEKSNFNALSKSHSWEQNDFKQKDIIKNSKAIINQHKPEFSKDNLAFWGAVSIGKFNFEKNTYPIRFSALYSTPKTYDYLLKTDKKEIVIDYKPKTEAEARHIEDVVLKTKKLNRNKRFLKALVIIKPIDASYKQIGSYKKHIIDSKIIKLNIYPNKRSLREINLTKDLLFNINT